MDIGSMILTVFGLCLFEIISSIDNAVINAEVLGTMGEKAQRWFKRWGLFFAVVMVRLLLPWIIIWATMPGIGPIDALFAAWSDDPAVHNSIQETAPVLFMGGGIFLVFLFFHWIFLETKNYGLRGEKFLYRWGVWFFSIVSIILAVVVWYSLKINAILAFSAVLGSTVFFITNGFKENAEKAEKAMMSDKSGMSDLSKLFYLEIIDATFSIDGVLGAFAFTLSIPLILIGTAIGALVLRELTVKNIDRIKKYKYLKNGAMYSIFVLGVVMVIDAFGVHIPQYVSPVLTFGIIGYFFWKSYREI